MDIIRLFATFTALRETTFSGWERRNLTQSREGRKVLISLAKRVREFGGKILAQIFQLQPPDAKINDLYRNALCGHCV
jgi:hypothetical protein